MLYILDTADTKAIAHCNEFYPLAGVTTNPSIISKERTDFFALLLRKTVLGDTKEIQVRHKHRVAYAVGSVLDKLTSSEEHTHAKKFSRVMETVSHTTSRILGNFSFALLMACLGICTILLLLIFVF